MTLHMEYRITLLLKYVICRIMVRHLENNGLLLSTQSFQFHSVSLGGKTCNGGNQCPTVSRNSQHTTNVIF